MPGQEPRGCDQNHLVTNCAVLEQHTSINKQEDRIQLHGGSATYPTCMAAHSLSDFLKTKGKVSSATAFLEAVVVQPHLLETRETSKESTGKCTEVIVAQIQNLKTRETSKESFGKCTELVVVQPHLL